MVSSRAAALADITGGAAVRERERGFVYLVTGIDCPANVREDSSVMRCCGVRAGLDRDHRC